MSALSTDTENPPSQSMLRAIQRHREVYLDYARELRRTKVRQCCAARIHVCADVTVVPHVTYCSQGNVQTALDQANLLSGVRNDIECVWLCCEAAGS